jgi:hypothetical protein
MVSRVDAWLLLASHVHAAHRQREPILPDHGRYATSRLPRGSNPAGGAVFSQHNTLRPGLMD